MKTNEVLDEITKEVAQRRYAASMSTTERRIATLLCEAGKLELTANGVYRFPLKPQKGMLVEALTKITSDDRSCGQNQTDPIIRIGDRGCVLGRSEEFMEEGHRMKQSNCWVVQFDKGSYDVRPEELALAGS